MKKLTTKLIALVLLIIFICGGCAKMPEITVTQGEQFTPIPSVQQGVQNEVIKDAEYFEKAGVELRENEKVDGIYMGMSKEDLFQILGDPDNAGAPPEQWGGEEGRYHITYLYDKFDSYFEFSSNKEDEGYILIIASFGSKYTGKTSRNIGIGSSRDEVIAAYLEEYNELQSIENNTKEKQDQRGNQILIMGDILGGICFYVDSKTNLVQSFLLGTTAAE